MSIDYTRLINKEHPLPAAYVPHGLVDLGLPFTCPPSDPRRLLEKKAAHAAMELITRASQEGISLYCISGYRSYARQKELYRHTAYVAAPGTSEHQSGLALDLSCPAVNMELIEAFADTLEGIWLARHAPLYGFVLRYPANKESVTQYPYEPWHIRYVTRPLSAYLAKTGLVLEEYHAMSEKSFTMTV